MPVALRKRKKEHALAFTEEVTIYQAEAIAGQLKEVVDSLKESHKPLVLDLKGVTDMDSSGVQLLLALKKSLAAKDFAVDRTDHGSASLSIFELYQLTGESS